jgi:hypothetical protein
LSNPIILYDNRFEDGALSATNTATGYDVNNIKDLRTYTYWKANAAGTLYITEAPLAEDAVTLANMRLSLVDGKAFVDFSTADVLTDYIGKRIVIIDSAGKKIIGYIKAAGTEETYDAALYADTMAADNTGNWSKSFCALTFDTDHYVYDPSNIGSCISKTNLSTVAGKLMKASVDVKNGTGSTTDMQHYTNQGGFIGGSVFASAADYVARASYFCNKLTQSTSHFGLYNQTNFAGNVNLKNYSVSQVLTPAVTGVTIVSAPGGSTYNWESIESGFNYYDSAGYTYKISESDACDTLGIMGHNLGTAGAAVSVESSDDESTWTERLAAFSPTDDKAILKTMTSFRAASKRLKIVTASTAPYLAVAMLGVRLEFNRGCYIGDGAIVPWQVGIVAEFNRSKTGNLLGNTIRYKPITIDMTIPTDTYDWYNTYFWPFWRDHGSELKPFFFAPDLTTFTDKIFWMQLTPESVLAPPMLMKDRVDMYTFSMQGVLEE